MLGQRIFTLPEDVKVHPGHGEDTVMGREKDQFADFSKRSHKPDLCGNVLWRDA